MSVYFIYFHEYTKTENHNFILWIAEFFSNMIHTVKSVETSTQINCEMIVILFLKKKNHVFCIIINFELIEKG